MSTRSWSLVAHSVMGTRPKRREHWLRAAAEDDGEQWVEPLDPAESDAGLGPRHQACLDLVALLAAQSRFD